MQAPWRRLPEEELIELLVARRLEPLAAALAPHAPVEGIASPPAAERASPAHYLMKPTRQRLSDRTHAVHSHIAQQPIIDGLSGSILRINLYPTLIFLACLQLKYLMCIVILLGYKQKKHT